MGEVSENCVACSINLLTAISSWTGFPCLTLQCTHQSKRKTRYFIQKRKLFTAYAVYVYVLVMVVFFSGELMTTARGNHLLKITNVVANLLYCVRSAFVIAIGFGKKDVTKVHFEGFTALLEQWEHNEGKILLRKEEVEKLKTRSLCYNIAMAVFMFGYLVYVTLTINFSPRLILEKICTFGCLYIDFLLACTFSQLVDMYATIFVAYQKYFKTALEAYQGKRLDSYTELQKFRRLHSAIFMTFNLTHDFCCMGVLVWLIIAVMMLVCNNYVLVVVWAYGQYDTSMPEFVEMEVQLISSGVIIFITLSKFEILAHVHEDLLSFLFKYPISKLAAVGATQVEVMISTIIAQQPILRISDIFTVSIKQLAGISGTVVTYVLVVLQFHPSWTKH